MPPVQIAAPPPPVQGVRQRAAEARGRAERATTVAALKAEVVALSEMVEVLAAELIERSA